MPTTIVQLSDLHVRVPGEFACGRVDTNEHLRQAVATVRAMVPTPDAVVLTGDLVDLALPAEYQHLGQLLRPLPCKVFLLAGNHDDGDALRAAFGAHAYLGGAGDLRYSAAIGELQLIALDTTVRGQTHGALGAERLDWLARELEAARSRPVVVAMHHPPFRTSIAGMDAIGLLEGADALAALLRRHANVQRVICGHVHRAVEVAFGGTLAAICPSPAHQVHLDLRPDATEPMWNREPGGLRVHVWDAAAGLVTHLLHVGSFPGPFTFDD